MNHPPLFFQKRETLLEELPSTPDQVTVTPLVNSYLDHYHIHFLKQHNAKAHQIWRSNIAQWQIIEQRWQPRQTNGKTLIICHGYFDHTGFYGNAILWALKQGYQVHCFDLPGHGLSSGEPAAIEHFDDYTEVLGTILHRENYSHYVLLGQSTGCAVILNYLLNPNLPHPCKHLPQQVILLAPLIRIHFWPLLRWLYWVMRFFKSDWKRTFMDSSHDDEFNRFQKQGDPLQTHRVPLCWLGAMDVWNKTFTQLPARQDCSCVVIQGTGDATVDYRHNLKMIRHKLPTTTHLIKGARHHLVKESDPYWQQVSQLLSKYL